MVPCFHLFLALRALHAHKLTHNDIKPENLIWFPPTTTSSGGDEFKLTDLGLSFSPESYRWKNSAMFATGYRAPEILLNTGRAQYSYPADIWAAGVCLCFLIFGSASHLYPDSERYEKFAVPPFPIGNDPLEIWKSWIGIIGLPSSSWRQTYLRKILPGFTSVPGPTSQSPVEKRG